MQIPLQDAHRSVIGIGGGQQAVADARTPLAVFSHRGMGQAGQPVPSTKPGSGTVVASTCKPRLACWRATDSFIAPSFTRPATTASATSAWLPRYCGIRLPQGTPACTSSARADNGPQVDRRLAMPSVRPLACLSTTLSSGKAVSTQR